MNNSPREILCKLVSKESSICEEPKSFADRFKELCLDGPLLEVNLLVTAVEAQVPERLLAGAKNGTPNEVLLSRVTKKLVVERGLSQENAEWTVKSGALALNIIYQHETGVDLFPQKSDRKECKTNSLTPKIATSINQNKGLLSNPLILGVVAVLVVATLGHFNYRNRGFHPLTSLHSTFLPPKPKAVSLNENTSRKGWQESRETGSISLVSKGNEIATSRKPQPVIRLSPSLPTLREIENAIYKLEKMNPNVILEFPVEENSNYRVIGFRDRKGRYFGWNVRTVKKFLYASLNTGGKFPKNRQISLIVRNQSTKKRLILRPIEANNSLEHFVRSLNATE